MRRGKNSRGSAIVEMTLVGIPIMFILISIFEISRGMWMYETMAYSVKQGVRYASVHGENCRSLDSVVNACTQTANQIIANAIEPNAVGIIPSQTTVTFLSADGTSFGCKLDGTGSGGCASEWPPPSANAVGQSIRISMATPFRSAMAIFWPGAAPQAIAATQFTAISTDIIQF